MTLLCFHIQATGQLPMVCSGSRVRYGVTASSGATFQWQVIGGSIIQNYNDSVDVQWFNDDSTKFISATEVLGICKASPSTDSYR